MSSVMERRLAAASYGYWYNARLREFAEHYCGPAPELAPRPSVKEIARRLSQVRYDLWLAS